jgi:hypothetical protein
MLCSTCYSKDLSGQLFKELRMMAQNLNLKDSENTNGKISLEALAKMTGFSIEMIKEEIFKGQNDQEVSLEDLRSAMLSYIDSTMLLVGDDK